MCDSLSPFSPFVPHHYTFRANAVPVHQGIDIIAGTDAVPQLKGTAIGPSLAQELYMYVARCGFTPAEALRAATGLSAKRFGFADRGRVAEGLRADLVLVKGDPTEDIEDVGNVVGVWKGGEVGVEYKG